MLHPLEYRFDLIQFNFYLFAADCSLNVLERSGQIAGFIDGIDDGKRDGGVHIAEGGETHLPQQVVLQVLGGFTLIEALLPVVDRACTLGRTGRIDFVPGGVDRELVRHLVLCHGVAGV